MMASPNASAAPRSTKRISSPPAMTPAAKAARAIARRSSVRSRGPLTWSVSAPVIVSVITAVIRSGTLR